MKWTEEVRPTAASSRWRRLVLVQKGKETLALRTDDIAAFYAESKVVFALTKEGRKFLCSDNLSTLQQRLDPAVFFRANRQTIVHINTIVSFRSFERVKLSLKLNLENYSTVIVSQQTAPVFKKWLYEA